jgi:CHASE2 domain-containing sensor protein
VQRTGGWTKHWVYDLIGAGLAIAVGLGALAVRPLGLWLEEWSYDLPYALRPSRATSGLILVSMDAASRAALTQGDGKEWDRQLHAKLLDRLLARGARAAVFLTDFSEPSSADDADRLFAQALRRARGKVVLAATSAMGSGNETVRGPIAELADAAQWGVLAAPGGTDLVVRRHGSLTGHPSAAARVAQLFGVIFTNALTARWLNYYAPEMALPEVSYEKVLLGTEPAGMLKGKIVLVGPSSKDSELVPTPYTRWTGRRSPQFEIEATAILNLSRREWLSRLPPIVETGIVIVVGGFFGLAFMGIRRKPALLLATGAVTLVVAGACVLVIYAHIWFPWVIVAGVQIPTAFAWSWLCEAVEHAQSSSKARPQSIPVSIPSTPTLHPEDSAAGQAGSQRIAAPDSPSIPDHNLVRCIGRGAYGEVWLVRDVIGRYHAAKIVKARNFPHPAPYEREFKGIEHFAPISRTHPGLMQILHVGRHDEAGYFFYIMELADDASGTPTVEPEGYVPKTLASELARRGHVAVQETVEIGLTLSSALQHLHEHRLVHRDIKPSNIIFVGGRTKIADIGLVAQLGAVAEEVSRLGTEGYLPPEGPGAPTADVYALGKVLYEISMGRDRWQFPEFPTTLGTRPDQESLRHLHGIILTACETDPAHRYPSAAAMHAALAQLLG